MSKPFWLRLFMPPGRRVVEQTNSAGVGLAFPRTRLNKALKRVELP